MKIISIIGTGTIGLPLVALFNRYKKQFGIDKVIFFKNTPLVHDRSHVMQLIKGGAELATDQDKRASFENLGMSVSYDRKSCLELADVIIDCTPQASKGRELYNSIAKQHPDKLFIAQGNAEDWGMPYARSINEVALSSAGQFVKVVSCNTHSIARLVKVFGRVGSVVSANFLCIRRSNDISQNGGITPSIEVGNGESHHAKDATSLFDTLPIELMDTFPRLNSSACKINSQYMHSIYFDVEMLDADRSLWQNPGVIEECLREDPMVSISHKNTSNKVFSFGRDFGYFGRILTQTVVIIPSVKVVSVSECGEVYRISGFSFTPQDGNSLMSSVAATLWHLNNKDWGIVADMMEVLKPYLFQEI